MRRDSLKLRLLPLGIALAIMTVPFWQHTIELHNISQHARAAQDRLQSQTFNKISGVPVRILIPSLSIDLPVVKGSYSAATQAWSVADSSANYATNTAPINNYRGQSLIYGHNNRHVFGTTIKLAPGALAYIYTDNNHVFQYAFAGSQTIDPTRTDIFFAMANSEPGLKLITCEGTDFEYRHFMSFNFVKAS
jgi:LPXTG-site transpeptidase (sortase) family protein